MGPLRLFIALELDDTLRRNLKRVQTQFQDAKNCGAVSREIVRWVAPQNIHLTLKFLGNTNSDRVPALKNALERIAHNTAPFQLNARGLGCFPNTRRPNNVWVGLDGALDRAVLLAQHIEQECATLGFERDERGFTPHLTLGRVQRDAANGQRAALGECIKTFPRADYGSIDARAVFLISSDLRPGGPIYTIVSQHSFSHTEPV